MGTILRIESGPNSMQAAARGQTHSPEQSNARVRRLLLGGILLPVVLALPAQAWTSNLLGSPRPLTQDSQTRVPERYVLAGASGARIRNLPDSKGREVLQVAGDTPLAVYKFRPGNAYLKVAVPGGVKIWVYGKYLTESSRPGWVEVSGSYVNMRPLPRSQDSYPLGQLDRGARLRFIQRLDSSKPMSEDWVQVYSPPETMAFVLAAETRAMPASADSKTLWASAVQRVLRDQRIAAVSASATLPGAVASGASGKPAAAKPQLTSGAGTQSSAAPGAQGIFAMLAAADRSMDQALAGVATPDYKALTANYNAVLALGPDASTRHLVGARLERLEAHRELSAIRAEIASSKREHEQQLKTLQKAADRSQRGNDPLWGRFQTRGWLERQTSNGVPVYLVRWGSDFLAQVQCSSGRYQLDLFEGFEIGVKGASMRAAEGDSGGYPLIDVDRIEVISARRKTR